jgi:4-amino-4-deoxy-L-arabinose transferase-like glycosyltransferase
MKHKLLFLILLLGFVLRIVYINKIPYGFTPDEASYGYDAYSILKTGKDQWGHSFPLVLESFGDFKPPLYSYVLIPFVWLFGLEKWVIRIPNAIFGTLAIYVTYLLVIKLFEYLDTKKNRSRITNYRLPAILAALLLAISPWHIMMSRGAFEANLTTFFLPLGIYFFLKGLKKSKYLILSAFVFGINLFSYHSAKLVTPLIVVALVFIYWNDIRRLGTNKLIKPVIFFGFFVLLTVYTFTQGAGARVVDVNIFNNSLQAAAHERTIAIQGGMNPSIARLFHNKYQFALRKFSTTYFQYISPQFLFTQGPGEATYGMVPGRGVLYWFELPLLVGFLIFLVKNWKHKLSRLLVVWILVAPIPAALAVGPGYAANRAVIMLPAIQVASSMGFVVLYLLIKSSIKIRGIRIIILTMYTVFSLILFISFVEDYFFRSYSKNAKSMLYGNLEASYWVRDNTSQNNVYMSRKLSEPHIYIAFANKLNPEVYQRSTRSWKYSERGFGWVDQIPEYRLANFTFKNIHLEEYLDKSSGYLFGRPDEFPKGIEPHKVFYYPDGEPAIFIIEIASEHFIAK